MKFTVKGFLEMGREAHEFEKSVEAQSKNMAKEYVYSKLGGDHGVSRTKIKISDIKKED